MDYEKKYKDAIERLRDAFYDNSGRMCKEYRKAVIRIIEPIFPELKESEDERIRKYLTSFVELNSGVNLPPEEAEKILAWIDKQSKQKPAEWSAEDDQYLLVCKNALRKYQVTNKWDSNIISQWLDNKLKSLKERVGCEVNCTTNWKPTDEQMEAIKDAIEFLGCTKKVREDLKSLYEQLKKLKES